MASRPLPPGRRGRGGRAAPSLQLPEPKILGDASIADVPTSAYVEQLRAEPPQPTPEPVPLTKQFDFEPSPVRSVKAFVSSMEKGEIPQSRVAAAAAGEEGLTSARAVAAPEPVYTPIQAKQPGPVTVAATPPTPIWQAPVAPDPVQLPKPEPTPVATPLLAPRPVQHPVQQPIAPPPPVQLALAPPAPAPTSAPAPDIGGELKLEGFHPFKLLLPIYAVPEIPESIDCVYDDEAVEMQKNVMKTVKKVFGKDRSKLEDFKINSRLFGNNFMDPLEYVESLVKDLGGNRALLLVPCLVSIQPDYMKRNSMLVAARNYRMRYVAKLEASLDKIEVETVKAPAVPEPTPIPAVEVAVAVAASPAFARALPAVKETIVVTAVEGPTTATQSTKEEAVEVKLEEAVTRTTDYVPASSTSAPVKKVPEVAIPSAHEDIPERAVAAIPEPQPIEPIAPVADPTIFSVSEPVVFAASEPQLVEAVLVEPTPAVPTVPVSALASPEPTLGPTDVGEMTEPVPVDSRDTLSASTAQTLPAESSPIEPVDTHGSSDEEPHSLFGEASAATNVVLNSASSVVVAEPIVASGPSTPSTVSPTKPTDTLNFFGEEIDGHDGHEKDAPVVKTTAEPSAPPSTVSAPAVSTPPSIFEAESLFGEVIPVAVKPVAAEPAVAAPQPLKPRPAHTDMLFGFASAADSDSDSDSEFSD